MAGQAAPRVSGIAYTARVSVHWEGALNAETYEMAIQAGRAAGVPATANVVAIPAFGDDHQVMSFNWPVDMGGAA